MLVAIRTPADNERGPRYMEKVFAAIHQAGAGREPIQLEYGHHGGEVGLFLRFPNDLRRLILEPFAAKYPACRFAEVTASHGGPAPSSIWYVDVRLSPELYPILRHAQFEVLLNRANDAKHALVPTPLMIQARPQNSWAEVIEKSGLKTVLL